MRMERGGRALWLALLLGAAGAVPRQPAMDARFGLGPRARVPPLDQGCPEPCSCAPVQLTAVFGLMLFVRQVVMNCTATALTALPGPVFYEVYALLLSHNNITQLGPHGFAADMQVSDLRELDLRDNAIHTIDEDALKGLHSLTSIALDRNKIQTVPPQLFDDCPEIEYVSLSENPLILPASGPFFSAPTLSVIDISKCGLRSLPDDTFSEMPMLHIVYLADNPQIGQTNVSALSQLEHLHGLTLMRNERMTLTGPGQLSVRELGASGACQVLAAPLAGPHLTKLSAQGCGLSALPAVMAQARPNLEMLLLGRNAFTGWDASTDMPYLAVLGLDLNNITRLEPAVFSSLPSLGLLNLSGNALQAPEHGPLLASASLHSLDLFNCSLRRLPEDAFSSLPQLVAVDLSLNGLAQLPAKLFRDVPQLQQVFLSDNGLQSLPADLFVNNHQLRRLHLSGNPLLLSGEKATLPTAPSVVLLELDRMELTGLQASWFDNMPHITNLSLADNKLSTVSVSSVKGLTHLQQIRLIGNKLQCNAALLPFYEWTKENAVHIVAKCAEPRGNWQLMEHLHFEEEEKLEHEKQSVSTAPTSVTSRTTIAVPGVTQTTVRQVSEVVPSPASMAEFSQQAVQAASVGGSSSNNDNNKSSGSGNGSLWVVLLVGVLVGGIAGAVLTALFARRIQCPSRAPGFLHIRLRDTASVAEEYGDDERLGS
ncbi:leucine-rich repeat-containing G-protein coupled receptor 5-like [Schistocerca gregaria]|uniref:leucine-rich repeat-containing G-protein coupled receptor 5-like n=1 Tax=Schistocerca gregaria TaxID=7010 RepID=UPI00211F27B9|nr:leucine-rich repeat-containing G-protein coupled receptor 5-like [Schistocerca gregaria]